MAPAAARWVLDTVLAHRRGWPVLPCSCLLGPCGACAPATGRPDHGRCLTRRPGRTSIPTPEGCITHRGGFVVPAGPGLPAVTVWLADRTCSWSCPCPCDPDPAGPVGTGQAAAVRVAEGDACQGVLW